MADNKKLRYDAFVANVQPDPAKPEPTLMLSGFVGRGPDGHTRIYPDPTLATWYDVPEDAVIHSMPIEDSKLGGSHVWVRANAQIKPGTASAPAAAAPAAVVQAVGLQPTPATHCFICPPPNLTHLNICQQQPTPATMCFICPPHNITPATVCTHPGICQPQQPTPATMCFICPPPHQTLDTLCTQLCTHVGPACPPHPITQPVVCGIVPPSFGCPPGAADARLQTLPCPTPNSLCQVCNQGPDTPNLPRVAPGFGPIGQTFQFHCPTLPTLTTSWFDCHTQMPGCTVHVCFQAQPGAAFAQQAAQPAAAQVAAPLNTAATVCTQIGCPPAQVGQIHPTLWTLPPFCPPQTCIAHTVHPTLQTLPPMCPRPTVNPFICGPITLNNICNPIPVQTVNGCIPGTLVTQMCVQTVACIPGRTGVFTPFGG